MQYYGIDWLATVCGLTGVFLIGSKKRTGFLILMLASMSWLTVGILIQSMPLAFGSVIYFSLHVRGWLKWKRGIEEV